MGEKNERKIENNLVKSFPQKVVYKVYVRLMRENGIVKIILLNKLLSYLKISNQVLKFVEKGSRNFQFK